MRNKREISPRKWKVTFKKKSQFICTENEDMNFVEFASINIIHESLAVHNTDFSLNDVTTCITCSDPDDPEWEP